jgi:hypothetical protein
MPKSDQLDLQKDPAVFHHFLMLSVKAIMSSVRDDWQEDWFNFPCGWTISLSSQIERMRSNLPPLKTHFVEKQKSPSYLLRRGSMFN